MSFLPMRATLQLTIVSNFASVLFILDLRERLIKQTDAKLLIPPFPRIVVGTRGLGVC